MTFATHSSNKALAEFMQAQWKQNLGITISLSSMDNKTYMNAPKQTGLQRFCAGYLGR